jgi:DNA-binding transcriptional LysR family regulator
MDRDLLPHLPVALAVARRGGFAAAAAVLGMSPSAVSHAVKTLEDRLGAPLFARTTRSVALTQAGESLVATLGPALDEIQETLERLRSVGGKAVGLLRVNAPRAALPIAITPIVTALAARYPDLVVEIASDDALTDIVAGGFDAGVRLGGMIAQDMIAIRLTPPFKAILVASPTYLEAKGEPKSIDDLARHNCIGFRLPTSGGIYVWELIQAGEDVSVEVKGSMLISDPTYARELALAGVGIAYIFEPLVRAEIADGRLRAILPETAVEEPGLFLYYPRRAANAPKLRAFIEVAREALAAGRKDGYR